MKVTLLLRKDVNPCDHMNCIERFQEPILPPKESFYNVLNHEYISNEDRADANGVLHSFKCQKMGA